MSTNIIVGVVLATLCTCMAVAALRARHRSLLRAAWHAHIDRSWTLHHAAIAIAMYAQEQNRLMTQEERQTFDYLIAERDVAMVRADEVRAAHRGAAR